jgi:hypothetical protein
VVRMLVLCLLLLFDGKRDDFLLRDFLEAERDEIVTSWFFDIGSQTYDGLMNVQEFLFVK